MGHVGKRRQVLIVNAHAGHSTQTGVQSIDSDGDGQVRDFNRHDTLTAGTAISLAHGTARPFTEAPPLLNFFRLRRFSDIVHVDVLFRRELFKFRIRLTYSDRKFAMVHGRMSGGKNLSIENLLVERVLAPSYRRLMAGDTPIVLTKLVKVFLFHCLASHL